MYIQGLIGIQVPIMELIGNGASSDGLNRITPLAQAKPLIPESEMCSTFIRVLYGENSSYMFRSIHVISLIRALKTADLLKRSREGPHGKGSLRANPSATHFSTLNPTPYYC